MKFLIDENLPVAIAELFKSYGESIHVNQFRKPENGSISDAELRRYVLHRGHVVVTRDDDFVTSHVGRKTPQKLVFIHSNSTRIQLIQLVAKHLTAIIGALENSDLIELTDKGIRTPFEDFDPDP